MPAQDFWGEFVASHWEKRGGAFPSGFNFPGAPSERELFDLTVRACWQREPMGRPRVYFDHAGTADRALWPTPEDGGFARYEERVRRQGGDRPFLLVVNNLQAFDAERWNSIRRLLKPLFDRVGIPSWTTELSVFVGTYPNTPFGVHIDSASVMHFPVVGTKRIRTWSRAFADASPGLKGAVEYSKFLQGSELLEAGPGGMLYWPSDAWHVGEGTGELSVTWGVGMWYRSLREHVMRLAERLIMQGMGHGELPMTDATMPFADTPVSLLPPGIPPLMREVQRVMTDEIFSGSKIEQATVIDWLKRRSAWGFTAVPLPCEDVTLSPDDVVFQDEMFPIFRARLGGQIWIAANGHAFSVSEHPVVDALLDRLATCEPLRVRDLMEQFAKSVVIDGHEWVAEPETILEVLNTLCSLRGISTGAKGLHPIG